MDEILRDGFAALALTLPEGAAEALRQYYVILDERSRVMNLTAIHGEEDTARLHFLDCAALLRFADFAGKSCIDVGSGAGFPGLVLRILEPRLSLTLLDSQQKRVSFQQEVCTALGLSDVKCIAARAEEVPELRGKHDIAVSRAVARLNLLSELCLPQVKRGGLFIAMKGPEPEEELREAEKGIRRLGGSVERVERYTVPGTDAVHSAVIIRKSGDTPPQYPRRWAKMLKTPL